MTNRTARWFLDGLLVASALILGIAKIYDTDAWTHLALGRYIFQHRGFPSTEQFTFPSLGMPYYNPEWLFDLVFYLTYLAGGFPGVILLKASIIALIFIILLKDSLLPRDPASRRSFGIVVSVAVLLPFLPMLRHRFVERPDIVMMAFLGFTIYALNAYIWEGRRYLYLLPALQVLWVNMHPSILVGAVPFVAVLVGGGFQHLLRIWRGIELPGSPSPRQLRVIAMVFAAVILATLVNPYGIDPFLAPFRLATSTWLRQEVLELQAPTVAGRSGPFIVASLLAVAFLLTVRRLSLISVLLVIPFVYLGLSALRFISLLGLVSAPVLARHARALAGRLSAGWPSRLALPAGLLTGASIVSLTILTLASVQPFVDLKQVPGFGVNYDPLPEGALRYLDRIGFSGRLFNTFHWGGYIVWREFPRIVPSVDGRGYLPPGLLDEMMAARGTPSRLEEWRLRYGFDAAVLDYPAWSPLGEEMPDLDFGLTSRDWALVYWDDVALVYLRRTEALAKLIERDEYRQVKPANGPLSLRPKLDDRARLVEIEKELRRNLGETGSSMGMTLLGMVYDEVGLYNAAVEVLSPVRYSPLRGNVGIAKTAYHALAFAYGRLGHVDRAIEHYKKAAQIKEDPITLYNLGTMYAQISNDREAIRYLERALKLDRGLVSVYPALIAAYHRTGATKRVRELEEEYPRVLTHNLGEDHFRRAVRLHFEKNYGEAIAEFKAAIRLNPRNPSARSDLGYVYFDIGRLDDAFAEQKAALDIDPAFANAHYGLALIYEQQGEHVKARAHFEEYLRLEPTGYWSRKAAEELSRLPSR